MKYLFVCGAPRSGTTLLARLLGSNDGVVLGIERFKNAPSFEPSLFERQRFFDFRESDTNVRYEANKQHYDDARAKYDTAKYVGDKIPNLYKRIEKVNEQFESQAVFVFCYRNIYEVAASWDVRAKNQSDKWPEENNYLRAVEAWVSSFRNALRAKKAGVDVIPFNYNELVDSNGSNSLKYYETFLHSLGLNMGENDKNTLKAELSMAPVLEKKRLELTDEMKVEISQHIDVALVVRFMKIFRVGRIGMPEVVQSEWVKHLKDRKRVE